MTLPLSRINKYMFLFMFMAFAFVSKLLWFFDTKVRGIEYALWIGMVPLLIAVNFSTRTHKKFTLKPSYLFLLTILFLFCLVNYFFSQATLENYLLGFFFTFLFSFNFIIFYNIEINRTHIIDILKALIAIITLVGAAAYIERVFVSGSYNSYFLRGVITVAKDPVYAATLLNINIILSLVLFRLNGEKKYIWIAVFSFITIAALLFIKSLLAAILVIIAFISFFYYSPLVKIILYTLTLLLIAMVAFFGRPLIEETAYKFQLYFGENSYQTPRNALYIAGFQIAKDYFPLGSGQGTFGSYPVGRTYSDIYFEYKLDKLHGLGPEDVKGNTDSHFIFDTYWSGIMGEMGFIAFAFFLILWAYPALKAFPFIKSHNLEQRSFAFIIIATTGSIFLESIAAPTPGQLQFILLFAGLSAMLLRKLLYPHSY
jgi:hypothetical protein